MSQANRAAFTMVELMIVIGVIALLAGMILAGVGIAQNAGKKAKTISTITNLQAAIGRYESQIGGIPEAGKVTGAMEADLDTNEELDLAVAADNNRRLIETIRSIDGENFGSNSKLIKNGLVIDAWDKPLVYRPYPLYPLIGGHVAAAHSDDPPRPDSYQIWSFGKNGRNDDGIRHPQPPEYPRADDLTNW